MALVPAHRAAASDLPLHAHALLLTLATSIAGGQVVGAAAQPPARVTGHRPDSLPVPLDTVALVAPRPGARAPGTSTRYWSARDVARAGVTDAAELLEREGVHVRSYGPGMLSSVSLRGGGASQTLALWEGVPLVSPSLGQLDWSLIDLGAFTHVALVRGGDATAWGSGAVSGTLVLDAAAPSAAGASGAVSLHAGAFGERGAGARAAYGRGIWRATSELSYLSADNDYPYLAAAGRRDTERRQTNADQRRTTLRQSVYVRPGPRDAIEAHYWGFDSERGVAPTAVQNASVARQRDAAHRLTANWRHSGERIVWTSRAAHLSEVLDYRDEATGVRSAGAFDVWLAESVAAASLGRAGHRVSLGTTLTHTAAEVNEVYPGGRPRQWRTALFASYGLTRRRLSAEFSLRAGWVDGGRMPLTPTAGLGYRVREGLALRARVSRDYRLPTFNDRYWRPGGNPELRPESGWSQELGGDFDSGPWTLSLTGYHRLVRDWLLWARAPGESYWSATNLAAVRSAGWEARLGYRRSLGGGVAFELAGGYDYVRSVNLRALTAPAIDAGEQLWYVPRHAGFAQADLSLPGAWRLGYHHRWRGPSSGINAPVPSSTEADLRLSRTARPRPSASWGLGGFAEVRNLYNARVELIERRVLPGRHLRIGLTLALDPAQHTP